MAFELNSQQLTAKKEGVKWFKSQNEQVFEISGPAGSGKTSIVGEISSEMNLKPDEVLFMAYVGKAAMALSMKGNFAKTIHGSIYDLVDAPKLDKEGNFIQKNGRVVMTKMFALKEKLDPKIKLLVVDEGSMVNKEIGKHILSFGLPVLVLGDLNQLPPVFGQSFFLQNPDIILTQIMRQSENHPIIWLSQQAINGRKIEFGRYGNCYVIPQDDLTDDMLKNADSIICGRNETRQNINDYMRNNIIGNTKRYPMVGDKIVCRQNNWKLSLDGDSNIFLINGMVGYVENVYKDTFNGKSIKIDFRPEFSKTKCFEKVAIDYEYLFQPLNVQTNSRSFYNRFQFANAITCHLAQGSQYPGVLVYNEKMGSQSYQRKWAYTAITRAEDVLLLAM